METNMKTRVWGYAACEVLRRKRGAYRKHMSCSLNIPLNNPYCTPLYSSLYYTPLRSLDYGSHGDIMVLVTLDTQEWRIKGRRKRMNTENQMETAMTKRYIGIRESQK